MASKRVYGIDLGTTYSCIACVDESNRPEVLQNSDSQQTTPSVVYFENESNIVVGDSAREESMINPDQCVSRVKTVMGNETWTFEAFGEKYTPQLISSLILKKVVQDAQQQTGDTIEDVVITYPAHFGVNEIEATRQAGTIAGLNVRSLIPEPQAAALAFGIQAEQDQVVLVYDLGGGTFDVTVVELGPGKFTMIATEGDQALGGCNWDDVLVNYFADQFSEQTGIEARELLDDPETFATLMIDAEDAKRKLSAKEAVTKSVLFGGENIKIQLTREKFDELTNSLLQQTVNFTDTVIKKAADLGYPNIDRMLLVGGSTFMRQVTERMKQYPFEVQQYKPNLAVAEGAAIYAQHIEIGDAVKAKFFEKTGKETSEIIDNPELERELEEIQREVGQQRGMSLPAVKRAAETRVQNITSTSFGLIVIDEATGEEKVRNLIVANSPVPCEVVKDFGTYADNSEAVHLQLLANDSPEGPDGDLVDLSGCTEIGDAVLPFARPLPAGSPVRVRFHLGPDGRLEVYGQDLTTNAEIHGEFKTASVMSAEAEKEAAGHLKALKIT